jgi:hypothetical protein
MTKSKVQTAQNSSFTNTYGYSAPPVTPEIQAVLDAANKGVQVDPSTQQRFAAIEEDARRSYDDPFGAGTSPDVRAKAQRSRFFSIGVARDKAMREGYFDAEQASFGRKVTASAATTPNFIQTGGDARGNTNTTSTPSTLSTISQIAQIGGAVAG